MRKRVMLLALLCAAAPAAAQETAPPVERAAEAHSTPGPYRWARPAVAAERADARAAVPAVAADRTDDFLYHVLLTAVSALVTALIWRAVMD